MYIGLCNIYIACIKHKEFGDLGEVTVPKMGNIVLMPDKTTVRTDSMRSQNKYFVSHDQNIKYLLRIVYWGIAITFLEDVGQF